MNPRNLHTSPDHDHEKPEWYVLIVSIFAMLVAWFGYLAGRQADQTDRREQAGAAMILGGVAGFDIGQKCREAEAEDKHRREIADLARYIGEARSPLRTIVEVTDHAAGRIAQETRETVDLERMVADLANIRELAHQALAAGEK